MTWVVRLSKWGGGVRHQKRKTTKTHMYWVGWVGEGLTSDLQQDIQLLHRSQGCVLQWPHRPWCLHCWAPKDKDLSHILQSNGHENTTDSTLMQKKKCDCTFVKRERVTANVLEFFNKIATQFECRRVLLHSDLQALQGHSLLVTL